MKHLRFALLASLVLLAVSCMTHTTRPPSSPGYSVPDPASPTHYQITMTDYRFNPESLNVMAGDTVIWVNRGSVMHTTTSGKGGAPDGKWGANVVPGASFSYVFSLGGTYHYYCAPHVGMGMKGVVVVESR